MSDQNELETDQTLVSKSYRLGDKACKKLIEYICKYQTVRTKIIEMKDKSYLQVYTNFADNSEPTSEALRLDLEVISVEAPQFSKEEIERRFHGHFYDPLSADE